MPPTRTRSLREAKRNEKRDTVGVYLRLRPQKIDEPTLEKIGDQEVKTLPPDNTTQKIYSFTQVFEDATQSEIFNKVARPVVEDFITKSKNGLIFTYGITGSGKTFTMEGLKSDPGLIYRTIDFIFNSIGAQQTQQSVIQSHRDNSYHLQYDEHIYPSLARSQAQLITPSVIKWQNRSKETSSIGVDPYKYYCLFISLIELYNKQVHDLFEDIDPHSDKEKRRRDIRTDSCGVSYVANAVEIEVKSADEAVELYTRGVKRRRTGSTALNQESSRGHLVLNLKLVQILKDQYDDKFDEQSLITSQLSLVDLAGSERAKRSGATGGALHEACNINNSLGALRKCIRALRDPQTATSVQYREYSLTRLFKSYFEGHGNVCMVLCVNPTQENYTENAIAMDFGVLTQDVAVDYASPPKILKKSKARIADTNYSAMCEYLDKKTTANEPGTGVSDEEYIQSWVQTLKANRDRKKKFMETALGAQAEVRQNLISTVKENEILKQTYENKNRDIKNQEEQVKVLKSELGSFQRSRDELKRRNENLLTDNSIKQKQIDKLMYKLEYMKTLESQNKELRGGLATLIGTEEERKSQLRKSFLPLLKRPADWLNTAPSAPELDPMGSSPAQTLNPSTSDTRQSTSPTDTPNSSTDVVEHGSQPFSRPRSPPIGEIMISPTNFNRVPVINPRHNRSLSCSNMQWIHHKPLGTVDTGTVLKPKFKNGKSVRNLRSSDILHKDAAGYSVVHQDADSNGDIETSVYKGDIVPTVCGGKQVIINDIETMKQVSPKRRRAVSDAHYTN